MSEDRCPAGDTLLDLLAGLYEPGLEGFENPPLWVNAWNGVNYYYYDYGHSSVGEDSVDPLEVVEVKHEVKVDDEVGSPRICGGAYVNLDYSLIFHYGTSAVGYVRNLLAIVSLVSLSDVLYPKQ